MSDLGAEVRAEVEALHVFFTGWFGGALPGSDAAFARGLADHLHPDFEIVLPSGTVHDRDGLLTPIRQAWGANPGFSATVRDLRLLGQWMPGESGAGLVLAAYVEVQTGARNTTPADNLRHATVLFERLAGRLVWRHLHETALNAG
ncbi:MAG: hypothetical protein IID49_03700 [Proteobacteria bacterium]|nr:hypothetical protein [Pseudomonadota bacterium]